MRAMNAFVGLYGILLLFIAAFPLLEAADHDTYSDLFGSASTYNKHLRPDSGPNTTTIVKVNLGLLGITDIDEKQGSMRSSLELRLSWVDSRLSWTSKDSSDRLIVSSEILWIPDIDVLNRYTDSYHETAFANAPVWIYKNGTVVYFPRTYVTTPCHFDLLHFPFDSQKCEVTLGSWGHDPSELDFVIELNSPWNPQLSVTSFEHHSDWLYGNLTVKKLRNQRMWRPDGTSNVIVASLEIKRQSSFYYRVFVAPSAMILFLIPIIHLIPSGSTEKLIVTGLFLSAMVAIFQQCAEFFPAYSVEKIPLLMHLYTLNFMLLFLSFVVSTLTSIFTSRSAKLGRVPPAVRKTCLKGMGFCCCLGKYREMNFELLTTLPPPSQRNYQSAGSTWASEADEYHDVERSHSDAEIEMTDTRPILSSSDNHVEEPEMDALRDEAEEQPAEDTGSEDGRRGDQSNQATSRALRLIGAELQFARYKDLVQMEWVQLAIVIDRFVAFIFLTIACIVTLIILNTLS